MRYPGRTLPALVVATVGIAACSDTPSSPAVAAPASAPLLAKAASTTETPPPGARLVEGNISGGGNAVCTNVAVNPGGQSWSGQKFDPPVSGSAGGYTFTVSGDGKYLTFAPSGPTTNAVFAVVVKGGPNSFVYTNPAAGTQMRSPLNGGGNIPGISHYVVCFAPASTTITATKTATGTRAPIYQWSLVKKIDGIWDKGPLGQMIPTGSVAADGMSGSVHLGPFTNNNPLLPDIKWVEYRLTATRSFAPASGGVTGQICVTNSGSLATQGLKIMDQVQSSVGGGPFQNVGSATPISVAAKPALAAGESHCYAYQLPAASMDGATYRNTATVTITNHVGAIGSDYGPTATASFTLPSTPSGGPSVNATAVVTEDMIAECNTLYFTHKIACAMPEPGDAMPGLGADHKEIWAISGPTWTTHFFVDLVNFQMICTGTRTLTNVATLKPSDSAQISSNPVVLTITRAPCQ